jgi:hypothetical protein
MSAVRSLACASRIYPPKSVRAKNCVSSSFPPSLSLHPSAAPFRPPPLVFSFLFFGVSPLLSTGEIWTVSATLDDASPEPVHSRPAEKSTQLTSSSMSSYPGPACHDRCPSATSCESPARKHVCWICPAKAGTPHGGIGHCILAAEPLITRETPLGEKLWKGGPLNQELLLWDDLSPESLQLVR